MGVSMTLVMIITFLILILISVPIGWALGISAIVAFLVTGHHINIAFIACRLYNASNSFILMSLPFFILAGNIMSRGGLSRRLIAFCKTLLGPVNGGLGIVSIWAAFFFSAISGSNAATTAAVGGMMIPELEKQGYPRELSAATVAAAGTTGMVIPPSSAMVVYAAAAGVSLPALFMGGIIPGIMMSVSMMIVIFVISKKMRIRGVARGDRKTIIKSLLDAIGAAIMPIIILGGIYTGIFTATESAVIACIYAIIMTVFVYREITFKDLPKIFWESAITSAVGMVVITCASMFAYVLTIEHIPQTLCDILLMVTDRPLPTLLMINVILLLAGCVMTPNSAIIILVPILVPLCTQIGINPVALGIIMIVNLSIGAITPPVGGDVFVSASISKIPVERIYVKIVPFFLILLVDLVVLTACNNICLFLPNMLGLL
ncbi:MAG: TRAP transporter large permease [Eubacterium sp.]|nr:TRAP transporter large permease [Eubacterium sp.]